jgi:transcriptional regulator with XRE-family HTH domain
MSNLSSNDDFNLLFISENLKRLRLAHHLSTTQVAKVLKKSRQGYLNYEGAIREIGIHDLITLSGFYGVAVDDIVGNPFTLRNEKRISFRTYELIEGEYKHVMPQSVASAKDDVICVKRNDHQTDFFWRTQVYHKNVVMLFDYYDRTYISKVHYNKDGGGFFYLNDEPFFFTKANAEHIIYIGVFNSTLTKEFQIPDFF